MLARIAASPAKKPIAKAVLIGELPWIVLRNPKHDPPARNTPVMAVRSIGR